MAPQLSDADVLHVRSKSEITMHVYDHNGRPIDPIQWKIHDRANFFWAQCCCALVSLIFFVALGYFVDMRPTPDYEAYLYWNQFWHLALLVVIPGWIYLNK